MLAVKKKAVCPDRKQTAKKYKKLMRYADYLPS
jgi:hypothetical protein